MSSILVLLLALGLLAGALIARKRARAGSRLVALGAVVLFAALIPLVASRTGSGGEGTETGAATVASEGSAQAVEATTAATEARTSEAEAEAAATETGGQAVEQSEPSTVVTRSS